MFTIKWKRPGEAHWSTGLSSYNTYQEAQDRIKRWKIVFPNNEYWIETSDFFI